MRINAICGEIHSSLFYLADILYNNQTNSIGKLIVVQGNKLVTVGIRGTFQRTLLIIALQGYYIECCTKQDGLP